MKVPITLYGTLCPSYESHRVLTEGGGGTVTLLLCMGLYCEPEVTRLPDAATQHLKV